MAATSPAPAVCSPIDAARAAIEHTRLQLFPVRLQKWLVLGFLAFLDQCGRGAGWNSPPTTWHVPSRPAESLGGVSGNLPAALETALAWLSDHAVLVALGASLGFLIVLAAVALLLWVNARGTFMYLDGVMRGRAEIARPWREHAGRADSYFVWSFGIVVAALLLIAALSGFGLAAVLALARGRLGMLSGGALVLALSPILAIALLALPLLALARIALRDFVAPLQIAAGVSCGEAARIFEALLLAQPGAFVLYILLKLVLVLLAAVVVVVGGCLTCCLGFLPVVMQTLFQPIFCFERAWPVFLLRQMGYDLTARLRD